MSEELENQVAVEDGDSQESTESTGQQSGDRQPQGQRINLDDLPEFRKWKSQMDQRLSQTERRIQEEQQRAAELENRMHTERMAQMDESERLAYENQLLKKSLADQQKQQQQNFLAWQKEQDITDVATTLGVDKEALIEALPPNADSFVLWKVAYQLQGKKSGRQVDEAARKATEEVHIGASKPSGPTSKYQQMYDEAVKSFDVGKMLDVMAQAGREGITIKE
jgi:prolyl-tRNA editing enzyme YbaK/EbsC (Cys-tRNA(Pro) deacylase)